MQRFAGDTGVPGSSGLKVPKGFNQGTEKERRLWTGELMEVLKGTERSGRKARTSRLDQPWADLVASTAFLSWEEPFVMLSSAPRRVPHPAGRNELPASQTPMSGETCAWLQVASTPGPLCVLWEEGSCTGLRSHRLRPLSTFIP